MNLFSRDANPGRVLNLEGRKPSNGFSLVEILVSLAIVSIGMLAVMQMLNLSQKAQKGVESANEVTQLNSTLQSIFSLKSSCEANLVAVSVPFDPTIDSTQLQDPGFTVYFPKTDSGGHAVNGLKLIDKDTTYGGWNVNPTLGMGLRNLGSAGGGIYYVAVEVNLVKVRDAQGKALSLGSPIAQAATTTIMVSSSGGVITGCMQGPTDNLSLNMKCTELFYSSPGGAAWVTTGCPYLEFTPAFAGIYQGPTAALSHRFFRGRDFSRG